MTSHKTAPADPPRLGALEAQVMDVLWDHGPCTIRTVIGHLPNELAYTTIATVLTNLQRKDLVTSAKEKHSTRYSARVGREEQAATLMNHALDTSRDRAASMLHFMETMPDSDVALLREYLRRRDEGTQS